MNDHADMGSGQDCMLCPLQFKAVHIDKIITKNDLFGKDKDALNQGNFFEYKCTGAIPRNGKIPLAKTTAKGALLPAYDNLLSQVEWWKEFAGSRITDIETSVEYKVEYNGFFIKGIVDVKCKYYGKPTFIDLKATGVIDDKWSDNSWHDIRFKKKKTQQAVIYKWLGKQVDDIDYDFYFYVASTSDPLRRKVLKIIPNQKSFDDLMEDMQYVKDNIEYRNQSGWHNDAHMYKDYYLACAKCPEILSRDCPERIIFPSVEDINL
jgi:hypothetical protein